MTCITKQTLTLLNKINAVDPMAAASYMLMLLDDSESQALMFNDCPNALFDAFNWESTKEGIIYWRDLDIIVGGGQS